MGPIVGSEGWALALRRRALPGDAPIRTESVLESSLEQFPATAHDAGLHRDAIIDLVRGRLGS
jgi:hypothetical protein